MNNVQTSSMKAEKGQHWLFAHDSWFAQRGDRVFALGAFPSNLWQRYLQFTGRLTVLARALSASQADDAENVSSTPGVDFQLESSISGLKARLSGGGKVKSRVAELVSGVDGVVARLPSEFGLLAFAEAQRQGKPCLIEVAGCPWDGLWNYGTLQGKAYAPVMAARTRRAIVQAPFVTYVTTEFLQRRYPNRSGRQMACSDVEIDTPSDTVLARRMERIAHQKSPVKLGLIGTLKTRYKGIQTVLSALSEVPGQLPQVEFHVLGTGDPEPWMEEAKARDVADLVHFDGLRSPGEDVMAWLDDIDVYLQPSFKEGMPRATIEAMSRACPVIGSTCAGIPELLNDDCCIKPGDDEHLARLIARAVTDKDWQKKEAEANWQTAHEYSREVLDNRRNAFLGEFAKAVEQAKTKEAA